MGKLFTFCEWIMRLAYVNLLWFLFSLAGLVLLGIMPATVALFTIVRKWQLKETDLPIWKTFLSVYKQEFKKSNGLGICIGLSGVFIIFDFLYLRTVGGALQFTLFIPLLIITGFYVLTLAYIFPVYVHFELKTLDYIKNAFFLSVLNLHMTVLMLAASAAIIFLNLYQTSFIPFFSAATIAWILMFGGNYCFNRVGARQKKVSSAGRYGKC
ncbi:hypothetical protein COE25_25650 [Bacillus sp. AFS031507]|nr:hypothetical protein COE25_25650 [Bacillus sp. AFS031507]